MSTREKKGRGLTELAILVVQYSSFLLFELCHTDNVHYDIWQLKHKRNGLLFNEGRISPCEQSLGTKHMYRKKGLCLQGGRILKVNKI